jgi:CDP-glycerol glycerophosphotransferase (TagB/SpsB family)
MSECTKPTILLCWGYHRKGWIEIFESLSDQFDFHYLYWIHKEQEPASFTTCPVHYWSSFSSANQILSVIKPSKVIFIGSNSLLAIGLMRACVRQKVPTFTMQHGLFHDLKTNLFREQQIVEHTISSGRTGEQKKRNVFQTLSFFLRSIAVNDLPCILPLMKWQLDLRRMLPLAALAKNQTKYRRTDYYIVYTRYNGRFFCDCDGAKEEQMIEIGVPEFDAFFAKALKHQRLQNVHPYNLLIDSALTYIEEFSSSGVVSQEGYNAFISRLNEQSLRQNRHLYVKLHPYCYHNEAFIQHDNITYFRDADTVELIMNAGTVFGFDSTLMLASLYFRPTIIFTLHDDSYLQSHIQHIEAAPVLNYFTFTDHELEESFAFQAKPTANAELTRHFLYKADGQTSLRLKQVLLS